MDHDDVVTVLELVARVQDELAEACRASVGIPHSLADAVTALSICIGSDDCRLGELVDTPAGALLGADLQQLYCKGSLPARFCTPEAVLQSPVAVMDFLYGLVSLADAMPSIIFSSAALEPVASPLDSRLQLAMAAQLQDQKSGVAVLQTLQQLRQQYIAAAAVCLQGPAGVDQWQLGPSSPALEPLLHLALEELSIAGQAAAGLLGELSRSGSEQAGAAQPPQFKLPAEVDLRAQCGLALVCHLLPPAEEAAKQGRLSLQRLIAAAPPFYELVALYASKIAQLTDPELRTFRVGACGLDCVHILQLGLLRCFQSQQPSSSAQVLALKAARNQRLHRVAAVAAFAKVLHHLADAASTSDNSNRGSQLEAGAEEAAPWALLGFMNALQLLRVALRSGSQAAQPTLTDISDGPPALPMLPGAVLPMLQLAELLLRLAPKLPVLVKANSGREAADSEDLLAADVFLDLMMALTAEASAALLPYTKQQEQQQQQQGRLGSGGAVTEEHAALLRSVASLAGTAAKLGRCLPDMAGFEPPSVSRSALGKGGRHAGIMHRVTNLCACALALQPHVVPAPSPQHSLTRHLQRTGFLAFLCLPALAQARADLEASDRDQLAAKFDTLGYMKNLLEQLKRLNLVDVAVRAGGLGKLLRHSFELHLSPRCLNTAASLLPMSWHVLQPNYTQGLAVCLVQGGMLQAAAEHCLRLMGSRGRRLTRLSGAKDMLPIHTVLVIKAVCSLFDEHCNSGLLAAFHELLEGVPSLETLPKRSISSSSSSNPSGSTSSQNAMLVDIPRGAWVATFSTKRAWQRVCTEVMPALLAACQALTSGSQQHEQQDQIFRDVAVSAWTCCNPGCTNMAGQQEASLALKKCAGCGEARYCSSHCQRVDWRRHKPICQAIKELK